jgi:hypothetical protein
VLSLFSRNCCRSAASSFEISASREEMDCSLQLIFSRCSSRSEVVFEISCLYSLRTLTVIAAVRLRDRELVPCAKDTHPKLTYLRHRAQ